MAKFRYGNISPKASLFISKAASKEGAEAPAEPRIVNGRKVIEVTKQFHEISMSDSESELNTTNEDALTDDVR